MTEESKKPESNEEVKTTEGEKTFTTADVDRIVQERLNRDRQKYSDYDELRKKAADYEKQQELINQQDLEKKQEYDKLKETWNTEREQYKSQLEQSRQEIQKERVGNALTSAVARMNAHADAAILLKDLTKYNEDGSITIRGKDANGIDTDLPIEQGVEQFLRERPHLIKGSAQGGGNTSSGGAGDGNIGVSNENLATQLQNAMAVGDRKTVQELKTKIRMKHANQGISNIL